MFRYKIKIGTYWNVNILSKATNQNDVKLK